MPSARLDGHMIRRLAVKVCDVTLRVHNIVSVLMMRTENCPGHSFSFANSIKFPLIMYRKFVWPNLIWLDICLIWPENV